MSAWRATALADQMLQHLPDFCLSWAECAAITDQTAVRLLRAAAQRVYSTDKFKNRGEFGELLLHMVLKETMNSLPAVSKIYYKDSANDTVKGFDAVHVVVTDEGLELWLGEVKFYTSIADAIRDVAKELHKHVKADYLRSEFCAIVNKIDSTWPHAEKLKSLLSPSISLDKIFDSLCVPVLLTYDGPVTASFEKHCDEYFDALRTELWKIHDAFVAKGLPSEIRIHLFLVPLRTKEVLLAKLHEKLVAWQTI